MSEIELCYDRCIELQAALALALRTLRAYLGEAGQARILPPMGFCDAEFGARLPLDELVERLEARFADMGALLEELE